MLEGIADYVYLGKELGGYRKEGYLSYMRTKDFYRGMEKLKKLCREKTSCIICCERLYFKCHRNYIAKVLLEEGFKVIHIIDIDKIKVL